jgi:heme/copper-type cytochrome/quinol oxidase subunit 3
MLGGTISTPITFLLMSLGIPYESLTRVTSTTKISSSQEAGLLLDGMHIAHLVLGAIALASIIPSLVGTAKRNRIPNARESEEENEGLGKNHH